MRDNLTCQPATRPHLYATPKCKQSVLAITNRTEGMKERASGQHLGSKASNLAGGERRRTRRFSFYNVDKEDGSESECEKTLRGRLTLPNSDSLISGSI